MSQENQFFNDDNTLSNEDNNNKEETISSENSDTVYFGENDNGENMNGDKNNDFSNDPKPKKDKAKKSISIRNFVIAIIAVILATVMLTYSICNSIFQSMYAKAYLDKIGRNEEIRRYSEVEQILLTDVGVSVEVSNKILENKNIANYNYDLGYFESVEDGVRYIYSKSYDENQNKIICTKQVYDTKEIVEKIEIHSLTGEVIS